ALTQKRWTMRDLEKRIDFSYEHIRKVFRGMSIMSEGFNVAVCKALSLNEAEMWDLALREKMQAKYGALGELAIPGSNEELKEAWGELTTDQRAQVKQWVVQLADANRASRDLPQSKTEAIRDEIARLSKQLQRIEKK